jgi:FKBP-type peptidyl-prolyl cis-trans isomerase FkpA
MPTQAKYIFAILAVFFALCVGLFMLLSRENSSATVAETISSPAPTPMTQVEGTSSANVDMANLKIEDIVVGTGKEAKGGDTVTVNYKGTLENGTQFDSSYGKQPFTTRIGVGQVIEGWDQGIPGMKVGGKRKLTIPPHLGYGASGAGGIIPPNAALIFEVELLDVK